MKKMEKFYHEKSFSKKLLVKYALMIKIRDVLVGLYGGVYFR